MSPSNREVNERAPAILFRISTPGKRAMRAIAIPETPSRATNPSQVRIKSPKRGAVSSRPTRILVAIPSKLATLSQRPIFSPSPPRPQVFAPETPSRLPRPTPTPKKASSMLFATPAKRPVGRMAATPRRVEEDADDVKENGVGGVDGEEGIMSGRAKRRAGEAGKMFAFSRAMKEEKKQ
ncbi:unnamed protein product [Zymoseptoria tritici ST99CH_1A5]|uniref:Uncharacterized protein n=1 Tax=Zymoseptoria tritici ST99CH_1A5 TaxID=1276529 RepID=A0A1Y6M395_ZYMTR|nr:unnamed protein product [Zymoseptoria tritici ST99CH_1A5]